MDGLEIINSIPVYTTSASIYWYIYIGIIFLCTLGSVLHAFVYSWYDELKNTIISIVLALMVILSVIFLKFEFIADICFPSVITGYQYECIIKDDASAKSLFSNITQNYNIISYNNGILVLEDK